MQGTRAWQRWCVEDMQTHYDLHKEWFSFPFCANKVNAVLETMKANDEFFDCVQEMLLMSRFYFQAHVNTPEKVQRLAEVTASCKTFHDTYKFVITATAWHTTLRSVSDFAPTSHRDSATIVYHKLFEVYVARPILLPSYEERLNLMYLHCCYVSDSPSVHHLPLDCMNLIRDHCMKE